jgi:trehalose 6-phosphate phosphatase
VTINQPETVDPVARQRVLDALTLKPAGLFTDIDGTISAIAATPAEAIVTERARDALSRLAERLAVVGAVTGRGAADGTRLLGLPGLLVVGNHGMEWLHRETRWVHPAAEASRTALAASLAEIGTAVTASGFADGVVIEDKRLSASVHYRLVEDPLVARDVILDTARASAERHGLRVTEGRFVVELRPEVVINKGTAIAALVREHALNGVVYFGDDVTDVDAFVAIRELRDSGAVTAEAVAVLSAETHPLVSSMADVTVTGVDACIDLLVSLADALDERS